MKSNKVFPSSNPFPGLRPFTTEESELFFGRKKESEEVLSKLLKNRFITVTGASGSGKSSLVYCGVLPKIKELGHKESSPWRILIFRPGSDPFANLGKAINDNIAETGLKKVPIETILKDLHRESDGISTTLKKHLIRGYEKVLLVIDQFEELFRYSALKVEGVGGVHTAEFIENLVSAVSVSDSRVFTIVSMRADFIGECANYQGLTQLINTSNFLVPRMDRDNYRQVIEGPVKYAGAKIDNSFVEDLLDEIGDRPDQLPVLQHALMRTWTHWQELNDPARPVSHTDYDSVGTMKNAMSMHANEAYGELDQRGKVICEKIFRVITEKGHDNKGIRHPSSVSTIKSIAECTTEELLAVIDKFRIQARSFLTPRYDIPLDDDSIIDISHESLIGLWDRLSEWVDEEATSVQMYLKLSDASALYQQGKTGLLRPPDLHLSINWRDKQKPNLTWARRYNPAFERAMVYLRTSEKEYLETEERKIRLQKNKMIQSRILTMIFGGAALIALGLMMSAFIQKVSADRQTALAESEKIMAVNEKSRADSTAAIAKNNEAEALRQRELAKQQQTIAERNAAVARKQEKMALIKSDSAERARFISERIAADATDRKNTAVRLRMLSIGKSMSLKSLQFQGQKDLQTLLAYQAYLFNKKNGGTANDADIYAGLYNIAQQYGNENLKTFRGHTGEIKSIAFVPGEREFYTSGSDGQVLKWTLDGKKQNHQLIYSGTQVIEVLAISPDASWLAAGESNSSIHMIPLKADKLRYELIGHTARINSLIFSLDGKYLYSASLDGRVYKWDLASKTNTNIETGSDRINTIDMTSTGNYMAGITTDDRVIVWNPESSSGNYRIETVRKNIRVIRFRPGDNILAIGDAEGTVELWDVSSRKRISEVKAHRGQVNDIRFNTVLSQMATAGNDSCIKIFNTKDIYDFTEPPITLSDNEGYVLEMQFSHDGQLIVSGTYEGTSNLVSRPVHADYLVMDICSLVTRNMTQEEWNIYVGRDIPFEATCSNVNYKIKVKEISRAEAIRSGYKPKP